MVVNTLGYTWPKGPLSLSRWEGRNIWQRHSARTKGVKILQGHLLSCS